MGSKLSKGWTATRETWARTEVAKRILEFVDELYKVLVHGFVGSKFDSGVEELKGKCRSIKRVWCCATNRRSRYRQVASSRHRLEQKYIWKTLFYLRIFIQRLSSKDLNCLALD